MENIYIIIAYLYIYKRLPQSTSHDDFHDDYDDKLTCKRDDDIKSVIFLCCSSFNNSCSRFFYTHLEVIRQLGLGVLRKRKASREDTCGKTTETLVTYSFHISRIRMHIPPNPSSVSQSLSSSPPRFVNASNWLWCHPIRNRWMTFRGMPLLCVVSGCRYILRNEEY